MKRSLRWMWTHGRRADEVELVAYLADRTNGGIEVLRLPMDRTDFERLLIEGRALADDLRVEGLPGRKLRVVG